MPFFIKWARCFAQRARFLSHLFSEPAQEEADCIVHGLVADVHECILVPHVLQCRGELIISQPQLDTDLKTVEQLDGVDRASFPALMAEQLHRTVGKIRFVILLFGGALLLISFILVNNTIRLAIFSKRYLINTMKLVGATKWFIMKPFLGSALKQGLWSGLLAARLFVAAVYGLSEAVPELTTLAEWQRVGVMFGGLVGVGMVLALLFSAMAVNKFVNMKSNKIYLY